MLFENPILSAKYQKRTRFREKLLLKKPVDHLKVFSVSPHKQPSGRNIPGSKNAYRVDFESTLPVRTKLFILFSIKNEK